MNQHNEIFDRAGGVGFPNPNFQRLIPYKELPSDDEEEDAQSPCPTDPLMMDVQQNYTEDSKTAYESPSAPSALAASERKSFEELNKDTSVDVDTTERQKLVAESSPRNVLAHPSLRRRKKTPNLAAARIQQQCMEPWQELLEETDEGEMKVLWVRGQKPLGSCFNPQQLREVKQHKEQGAPMDAKYSSLLSKVHVHTELPPNHLEESDDNMTQFVDAQEPGDDMLCPSESECTMVPADDSRISLDTGLAGDQQQAACEERRVRFHPRPIMLEPLSESSSEDSVTMDKPTQASGSQVQPKVQKSEAFLSLSEEPKDSDVYDSYF